MIKIIKYIIPVFLLLFLTACEQDLDTEGISKVTIFPTIEFEPLKVVALGDSFTPTAIATEGGTEIPVTIAGTVDTGTVGIYSITFSATNSDGIAGSVTQTVVVHDPTIIGTDVSGEIEDINRPTRKGTITLVEGTSSIFYATDFAFGGVFPMYFQMDGDVISEINQPYIFSVTSVDLTYDPTTKVFTTLVNPYGFGYTFQYQ